MREFIYQFNPPIRYAFISTGGDFRTSPRAICELFVKSAYHVNASPSGFGPPLPCDSIAA
jgi:hypothetical protein